jgi:hypothetical protein
MESDERDPAARAAGDAIRERCLRVLKALLMAEPSMANQLDEMGVTAEVVRMLVASSTSSTFEATLELGVALLGEGNRRVQQTFFDTLSSSDSNAALAALAATLNAQCQRQMTFFTEQKQQGWYKTLFEPNLGHTASARLLRRDEDANRLRGSLLCRGSSSALSRFVVDAQSRVVQQARAPVPSAADPKLAVHALLLLQNMCRMQFAEMANFLRVQTGQRTQVAIVLDLVNNLLVLERTLSPLTISLTCQLYQTLIELVRGPCPANQRLLIGTNLCDVATRCIYGEYPSCEIADVVRLKVLCVQLLLAMVEGVHTDTIPRRIASSLDLSRLVLEMHHAHSLAGSDALAPSEMNEMHAAWRELGFYHYLLLCALSKHAPPALLAEPPSARAAAYPFFAYSTGAVEILMADETLQTVYFVTPPQCAWLTDKAKEQLNWEVDRSTPQKRVEDFVRRSAGLVHGMLHNERISTIAPFQLLAEHASAISTCMFFLSCLTNVLVLLFTVPDDGRNALISSDANGLHVGARQLSLSSPVGLIIRDGDTPVGDPVATPAGGPANRGYWAARFEPPIVGSLVNVLGVALFIVATTLLLEHCISTLPLTLRAVWERHGVLVDVVELWPLRVRLEYLEHDEGRARGDAASTSDAKGDHGKGEHDDAPDHADEATPEWWEWSEAFRLRVHVVLWSGPMMLLQDSTLQYLLVYLFITFLALVYSPFIFVLTLLDVVPRFRLLTKVIESVTTNWDSLSLTFIFIAIVVYIFTLVGQLFFREDYLFKNSNKTMVDLCGSTRDCLMTTFYLGLNYGGLAQGISDLRDQWEADPHKAVIRWGVDLLFFIAVIVLLMNIVFGIVIDTFAQQRDLQKEQSDNMENVCFVCGIDRNTFDRKHPHGYVYHIEHEHNIWHYLSFIIHINSKRPTEQTGPESYVAEMLAHGDLSFFPILKASSISLEESISNEALLARIDQLSSTTLRELAASQESMVRIEAELKTAAEREAGKQ